MVKILNLIIQDKSSPKNQTQFVESFMIREDISQPEQALREAVKEFVLSGTEESKQALSYACGYFNWGDTVSSVPDSIFTKHGLTKLNSAAIDVFVDHDEVLCDYPENDQPPILEEIKNLIRRHIADGEDKIKYWDKGQNLFAEGVADDIAKQNEKLKELLVMDSISTDLIVELINAETESELIVIYEEILNILLDDDPDDEEVA